MIETITAVNTAVNNFIWGVPAMVCIIGVGLLLSVRTGFLQIRKFPYTIKTTIGRMFRKKDASDGAITPFQAVCTALAGTVGTGNIAGVAGAIAIGGPGAVFWMWCSALLGMCTKFAEVTLAVHFRERSETGEWVGGPMYYIKNGLGKRWQFLAFLYSLFGVLTVFGTGNATQVNTIVAAVDTALLEYGVVGSGFLSTLNLIAGIIVAMLVAMVLLGGIKRIGSVSEKLVPFMALFYIVLAVGVVGLNLPRLPYVLESIVAGAFNPAAFTGGTIGSLFISMQKGVSRGIFSNEAGLGTGSIAHACADTKKPVKQGMFGIFEVFADTIIICTLTAMVILCSGTPVNYHLRRLGFHLYRRGALLLCLFHHHRLGSVRLPLPGVPLPQRQGGKALLCGVLLRVHSGRDRGPGPAVEHRRHLQRPDEHPQPYRIAAALRHRGQADQGVLCLRGLSTCFSRYAKGLLH